MNLSEEIEKLRTTFDILELECIKLFVTGRYDPLEAYVKAGLGELGDDGIREAAVGFIEEPRVKKYIRALQRQAAESSILTIEEIQAALSEIAQVNVLDVIEMGIEYTNNNGEVITPITLKPFNKLTKAQAQAIACVKPKGANGVEIQMVDKLKSYDMLARSLGGYKDNVKVKGGIVVYTNLGTNNRGNLGNNNRG